MPWIELHHGFAGHKKVGDLARALGVERRIAIGTLACLWSWAVAMVRHGDVTGQEEEIAHATYFRGEPEQLMEALITTGWVDRDEASGALTIHDWEDYAGRYEAAKANARQRKQAERERRKAEGVTVTSRGRHADGHGDVTVTSREIDRDCHSHVTPYMYMTNTSTSTGTGERPGDPPSGIMSGQGRTTPPFEAVPAVLPVAPEAQRPREGHQEARTGRYKSPEAHSDVEGENKGLAGPPVELSTKQAKAVDKSPEYPEAFLALWASAPQVARTRSGKPKAYEAWRKATKRAHPEAIASGMEAFKVSHDWTKDGGAYVPGLHIWLAREVWDERPATQTLTGRQGLAPSPGPKRITGGASDDLRARVMAREAERLKAQGALVVEAEVVGD